MGKENEEVDGDENEDLTQDDLAQVDDLQPQSETVRETLERTAKEAVKGAPPPETLEIPKDFDDDDKKFWGAANPETQKYLLGRHKKYTDATAKLSGDFDGFKKTWEPIAKLMEPYKQVLEQNKLTAPQVVERYIKAEMFLAKDPVNALLWLSQRYNVTPEKLVEAAAEIKSGKRPAPGQQPKKQQQQEQQVDLDPNDPRDAAILALQKEANDRKIAERNRMQHEIDSAWKTFEDAVDKGGQKLYPHATVPEVKKMMGVLFASGEVNIATEGGIVPALKKAYEAAIFTHAPTREAVLKSQQEAADKKKAEEEKRKVEKAKGLRQSVTGSSTPGSQPGPVRGKTVRESMREAAKQLGGEIN